MLWIVKGEGMGSSTVEHDDLRTAGEEAKRLAEKNPGHKYFVMESVEAWYAEKPVAERFR